MYFCVSQGNSAMSKDEVGPIEILGFKVDVNKYMRNPPHLDTLTTQASSLERQRAVHLRERKQYNRTLGILHYT